MHLFNYFERKFGVPFFTTVDLVIIQCIQHCECTFSNKQNYYLCTLSLKILLIHTFSTYFRGTHHVPITMALLGIQQ